ncbi:MAG: cell envelope integrity protein TolA [Colwellia sp.]|nr:cell envelope integrity protein TolA [Colwellia sp.]
MSQKYTVALALSIAIHVGLVVALFSGDFIETPKPTKVASNMQPIQAVAIERSQVEAQIKKIKKKKADDDKRLRDLEKRVAAAKKRSSKEERRIKDLERQRKKKEKEKKKADDAAKRSKVKAAAAEKDLKKKVAEKQKADKAAADAKANRLKEERAAKKADDLRKKKAAERKRKEQDARELAEQERLLEQQMAEEMAERQSARRQQMMTEVGIFTALITQTIQRNLITDRSTMEGKSCKLTISLAPSGFVTNVRLGQGDRTVCDAAKTAIYKAGTLPVSKDPEVFKEMSTISLTVVPEFN